ncbi:MAG: HK97 gp10 family phage protein [Methylomicrobium sp.]|nr:HK97 gp10 family phage protein [Methylomicrobium sp.]
MSVSGVKDFNRALQQLPAKMAEKIAKKALRKAANMVAKQARANAPVRTGRLKKAIRVRNSRYNRLNKNGVVGIILRLNPGKSRRDPKGAWYGGWVENGYNRGSRTVGGNEAVARGIVSRAQLQKKRAFINSRRRPGRVRQSTRFRAGGARVEGQHFIKNAFDSIKAAAAQTIIQVGTQAASEAARDVRLK